MTSPIFFAVTPNLAALLKSGLILISGRDKSKSELMFPIPFKLRSAVSIFLAASLSTSLSSAVIAKE